MSRNYPNLTRCLQGLKGLSEEEARAFFEMCERGKVTVKDALEIFKSKNAKVARSTTYAIMEKFEKADLVFADTSSKTKKYQAIHPKSLENTLKKSFEFIKKEIAQLEESYETADFEEEDPRTLSKTLHSESEITTLCNILCKEHDLFSIKNDDPKIAEFLDSLPALKRKVGRINMILFQGKTNGKKGIIQISKRFDKTGELRIFGQILYDGEKFDYFMKSEVKNAK